MIAILSPAKSMDFDIDSKHLKCTDPALIENADYLAGKLKKFSTKKIAKLMSLSDTLATLNHDRYQDWQVPHGESAQPCILAFRGDVYRGMNAGDFTEAELNYAQNHLRILSGLYGLLRPMDRILPYRLEMGTSLAVTPKKTNLYRYWDSTITETLNGALAESGSKVLVNLASNEYFKSVKPDKLDGQLITCHFRDMKNGQYKAIMTFAKLARGYMARFIVKNKIETVDDLRAFDSEGYVFNNDLSTDDEFVFTRG